MMLKILILHVLWAMTWKNKKEEFFQNKQNVLWVQGANIKKHLRYVLKKHACKIIPLFHKIYHCEKTDGYGVGQ